MWFDPGQQTARKDNHVSINDILADTYMKTIRRFKNWVMIYGYECIVREFQKLWYEEQLETLTHQYNVKKIQCYKG